MDPFVAEIRPFGFNVAPVGWAPARCNGALMPISQNTALFSLVGTYYGGDGKTTFALPNLQGSAPMGTGQSPGTTDRYIGEAAGSPTARCCSRLLQRQPAADDDARPAGDERRRRGHAAQQHAAVRGPELLHRGCFREPTCGRNCETVRRPHVHRDHSDADRTSGFARDHVVRTRQWPRRC